MCGIAGVHIKDASWLKKAECLPMMENFVDELFLGIEPRGRHAAGFAAMGLKKKKPQILVDKEGKTASQFIKTRKRIPEGTRTVLLHTRHWTQGPPSKNENNHPVCYNGVFVTHNGVITNDDEVFKTEDLERYAEVDSEAIAAVIKKHGIDGLKDALEKLEGGFAIGAVNPIDWEGLLVLAKGKTYPLVIHNNKQFIAWASDGNAIKRAWRNVISNEGANTISLELFEEGDVVFIEEDSLRIEKSFFVPAQTKFGTTHGQSWMNSDDFDDEEDEWPYWENGCYGEPCWDNRIKQKSTSFSRDGGTYKVLDLKNVVAARRGKNEGTATVHSASTSGPNRHRWTRCPHCEDMIVDKDITKTPVWGPMCLDCLYFARLHRFTNTNTRVDQKTRDDLESWAEIDWEVSRDAIEATAFETGIMPAAIFYLLYLASPKYLENNEILGLLAVEVKALYEQNAGVAWNAYFQQDDPEKKEETTKTTDPDGHTMIRHKTPNGGTILHIDTEERIENCNHCQQEADDAEEAENEDDQEEEAIEQLLELDLEANDWRFKQCEWGVCKKAGKVTHTNGVRYCVDHLAERAAKDKWDKEKKEERALAAARKDDAPKSEDFDRCGYKKCRKKAKNFMGTAFRFCDVHFNKCAHSKCKAKPVATSAANARFCHIHARGKKGIYFDNDPTALRGHERTVAAHLSS